MKLYTIEPKKDAKISFLGSHSSIARPLVSISSKRNWVALIPSILFEYGLNKKRAIHMTMFKALNTVYTTYKRVAYAGADELLMRGCLTTVDIYNQLVSDE